MLIKVKVFPGTNKNQVAKISENSFELKTKEKPLEGRANKSATELLAEYFNVPKRNVRLVRGFKSKNKIFKVKKA
jgi:uncharacterized protein (TIGR00251 family)